MSNASQCAKILRHLKLGKTLTHNQADRRWGCARLAARIHDLKKHHAISREMIKVNGKRIARYSIES